MTFTIEHTTLYRYAAEVFLEPHIIRLTPRSDPAARIVEHELDIEPEPAGRASILDAEGNAVWSAWFAGKTHTLKIVNRCVVETLRPNPFEYLVLRGVDKVPPPLTPEEAGVLSVYLHRPDPSDKVDRFGAGILEKAEMRTLSFLTQLNCTLYKEFETVLRAEGDPFLPAECLSLRSGACRDLTVLFMDACRSVGIPARFVSGYQEGDMDMTHRHLHAWPEVYIPGAGWRGYDPTNSLAVADRHIALASSHSPQGAAPITGSYRGPSTEATMEYELKLSQYQKSVR